MDLYNLLFPDENKQSIEYILNGLSSNLTNRSFSIENTTLLKLLLEYVPNETSNFIMELLFDKNSKYFIYETKNIPKRDEVVHLFDLSVVSLLSLYLFGGLMEKDLLYKRMSIDKEKIINTVITYSYYREEQRKLTSKIRNRLKTKENRLNDNIFSIVEIELARVLKSSPTLDDSYLLGLIIDLNNKVGSIDLAIKRKLKL